MTSKRHAEWDFNPAEPHLYTTKVKSRASKVRAVDKTVEAVES